MIYESGERMKFDSFFKKYNIEIKNKNLMIEAFTHSSYSNEYHTKNYERLEFLGDAVLQLITSEYFYLNTDLKEGAMSKERACFVCEKALATYAKEIGLDKYILVGKGQMKDVNDTIIADVFESVLGVIYLDCGFLEAKRYAEEIILPYIKCDTNFLRDYKSLLQELVQTDRGSLTYELISESGPSHDKKFVMEVVIDGIVYGRGVGKSKKEAEQKAAFDAYQKRAK